MSNFMDSASIIFSNPLVTLVLFGYLVFATYTDVKYLKIYDKFNLSLIAVRIIFLFLPVYAVEFRFENIIASIVVFSVMLTFAVMFMHKMGGDIKFLAAFMLFFDLDFMLVFMAVSSVANLIYAIILKRALIGRKKKVLEENEKEWENSRRSLSIKDKVSYQIIKLLVVKQPTTEELIVMDEKELKKFKMPFAPFFLIAYVVLFTFYYTNI